MRRESSWAVSRVGYVETLRVLQGPLGLTAAQRFRREWPLFDVVELDRRLADDAADVAAGDSLRSLDAIHLASAVAISAGVVASWDRRLHAAAARHGLAVLPARL